MTEVADTAEIQCVVCTTSLNPDDAYAVSYSAETVCSDCVRHCERCEDIGTENDNYCYVDGERWCENCIDYASWCDSCEEYSTNSSYYINDCGAYWCIGCTERHASYCEYCDDYNSNGCENCNNRVIHDYSYRPDPIFHSTDKGERLFFGVELEMEVHRMYNDAAEYAHQLEGMDLAYLKHDGSLNQGFELVTHPMSHDFYKNEADDLFRVIEGLRDSYQVKSWSTGTCGIHIHISRTGFNGGPHMHRFLNLIYSNKLLYETLAGRSSDRWAKFDDVDMSHHIRGEDGNYTRTPVFRTFKQKIMNGGYTDRYSAVNTQNTNTLEMRIFRGSTKGSVIKAHLDLAHASVEYTRTMSIKQVKEGLLSADHFMTYIESHQELYPELNERMARLITPSVGISRQNVSN